MQGRLGIHKLGERKRRNLRKVSWSWVRVGVALDMKISGDFRLEGGSQASDVSSPTHLSEEEPMWADSRDHLLSGHEVEGFRNWNSPETFRPKVMGYRAYCLDNKILTFIYACYLVKICQAGIALLTSVSTSNNTFNISVQQPLIAVTILVKMYQGPYSLRPNELYLLNLYKDHIT